MQVRTTFIYSIETLRKVITLICSKVIPVYYGELNIDISDAGISSITADGFGRTIEYILFRLITNGIENNRY